MRYFGACFKLDLSKNFAPLVPACNMYFGAGRQTHSSLIVVCLRTTLACQYCQALSSSNHHANWPKLCEHTHFKPIMPYAPFKLVQACASLLQAEVFLRVQGRVALI